MRSHGLRRLLLGVPRCFSSTGAAAAAPSTAFPSWLSDGARRIATPLSQSLPGVQDVACAPPAPGSDAPPMEVTTLGNGVRIVSEASLGPTASMGFYVNSGSIYETPATSGATALLECLAFKATSHRDTLRISKEIELLGANAAANGSREQMSYTVDCLRSYAPAALELLADCVVNASFEAEEVEAEKARLQLLLGLPDVQLTLLTELLARTAYQGALSSPLIPDSGALTHLTPAVLAAFVRQQYTGDRTVLAAAGLPHQQLVDLAAPMLESIPPTPAPAAAAAHGLQGAPKLSSSDSRAVEPASRYVGGHAVLPGSAPHANLILAFEYKGGWRDIPGSVIMTVLTYLLGGGSSFSSGGPGKGMHSRLYTRVLNHYGWVHSCSSYSNTFNTSGLVGVQAASEPARASTMLDVMCGELESLLQPPPAEQLERAKAMACSLIQNALEGRAARAEDIGRQFLTYGHRVGVREYEAMIQGVSGADIAGFVRLLLESTPSLAAYGDGADAVRYDSLLQRYGGTTRHAGLMNGGKGSVVEQLGKFAFGGQSRS